MLILSHSKVPIVVLARYLVVAKYSGHALKTNRPCRTIILHTYTHGSKHSHDARQESPYHTDLWKPPSPHPSHPPEAAPEAAVASAEPDLEPEAEAEVEAEPEALWGCAGASAQFLVFRASKWVWFKLNRQGPSGFRSFHLPGQAKFLVPIFDPPPSGLRGICFIRESKTGQTVRSFWASIPADTEGGTQNRGVLGLRTIGVLLGCFGRRMDGFPWFTWWLNRLPGKSIYFP